MNDKVFITFKTSNYLNFLKDLEKLLPLLKKIELDPAKIQPVNAIDDSNFLVQKWLLQLMMIPGNIYELKQIKSKAKEISYIQAIIFDFLNDLIQVSTNENLRSMACHMYLITIEFLLKFPKEFIEGQIEEKEKKLQSNSKKEQVSDTIHWFPVIFSESHPQAVTLMNQLEQQLGILNDPLFYFRFMQIKIDFYQSWHKNNLEIVLNSAISSLDLISPHPDYKEIIYCIDMVFSHLQLKHNPSFVYPIDHEFLSNHSQKEVFYWKFLNIIQPLILSMTEDNRSKTISYLINIYQTGLLNNLLIFPSIDKEISFFHTTFHLLVYKKINKEVFPNKEKDFYEDINDLIPKLIKIISDHQNLNISILFIRFLRLLPSLNEVQIRERIELFDKWIRLLHTTGNAIIKNHAIQLQINAIQKNDLCLKK